jgi:aryl-alcohol dehydrogenase-like predicted oxidoreductase
MGPGPNDIGTSRRHMSKALDAFLRRLGLQQIDLAAHAFFAISQPALAAFSYGIEFSPLL